MKNIFLFVLLVFSSNMIAQQVYGVQRGQRGYIPPPKYEASVYVTTINAYDELEKVLPKSVETFNLDDFEREIWQLEWMEFWGGKHQLGSRNGIAR